MPIEEWWDYEGPLIHIDRYTVESPKATIMLLHGGGGNGRILSTLACIAMRVGCNVVAPDFPGYGLTVRTKKQKPTYQLWREIASALIDDTKYRDQIPVIVWRLPIGGILVYDSAAYSKNADRIIATTLADSRTKETVGVVARMKILGFGIYYLFNMIEPLLGWVRLPMKWLAPMELISNNPEVTRIFVRDRLVVGNTVSFDFLRSLMTIKLDIEPEDFDLCPVLLAHPDIDTWTPIELSETFYNKIKGPKKLIILDGAGYFPIEEPGRIH
jgi:alpha-beta hydrolase superfamily lysophospholipase